MTPAEADAAVARGARVLDERGPAGWRETVCAAIRDGQLRMLSPGKCVLSHVYGDYGLGLDVLMPSPWQDVWAVDLGFEVGNDNILGDYAELDAAWARLLGAEVPA